MSTLSINEGTPVVNWPDNDRCSFCGLGEATVPAVEGNREYRICVDCDNTCPDCGMAYGHDVGCDRHPRVMEAREAEAEYWARLEDQHWGPY